MMSFHNSPEFLLLLLLLFSLILSLPYLPTVPGSTGSAIFFDEATALVKSNLHPLLNDLADRDQVLRDGGYMQYFFNVCLVTFFSERNIADVPNRMRSVVSGFDIAGSL